MWRGNFTADKSAINSASTRWNVCRMVARRSCCYRKWRATWRCHSFFMEDRSTGVVEYQLAIYPLFSLSCSALRRADVVEIAFIVVNSLFTPEDALSLMLASKVFVIVYEMLEILLYVRLSWMFNLKAGLCLEFIWIALGLSLGIFSKRFCWWIFFNLTDWMDDWVRWSRNIMNE